MSGPLDRFAMKTRCGDCAFTPGTDAHGSELSRATADLCVISGEPFYCHRANEAGRLEPRVDPTGEPVLCRGFVEAFAAQGAQDDWRAAVASEYLRMLEEASAGRVLTQDEMVDRITVAGERAQRAADV